MSYVQFFDIFGFKKASQLNSKNVFLYIRCNIANYKVFRAFKRKYIKDVNLLMITFQVNGFQQGVSIKLVCFDNLFSNHVTLRYIIK